MTYARMAEAAINASLDAYLHGAQHGDAIQARHLHEMLDKMLTEQETDEGKFWLTDHEYTDLAQMQGSLSLSKVENPKAFARANYMKMLDSWEM